MTVTSQTTITHPQLPGATFTPCPDTDGVSTAYWGIHLSIGGASVCETIISEPGTEPGNITLHIHKRQDNTAPALCGRLPNGGDWANNYRPSKTAYTSNGTLHPAFTVCPVCQVRRSYQEGTK